MSRRTLTIVAFVSLALNLFLIGGIVGAAVGDLRPHPPRPEGRSGPGMMAAAASMTPAQRDAWRTMLRAQAQESGPQLREARTVRRDAWRRIGEEPMDTQAILAELKRSRAIEEAARTAMDRRMVAFAAELPAGERRQMGEALSRGPEPRMRGSGRGDDRGRPGQGRGAGGDGRLSDR